MVKTAVRRDHGTVQAAPAVGFSERRRLVHRQLEKQLDTLHANGVRPVEQRQRSRRVTAIGILQQGVTLPGHVGLSSLSNNQLGLDVR